MIKKVLVCLAIAALLLPVMAKGQSQPPAPAWAQGIPSWCMPDRSPEIITNAVSPPLKFTYITNTDKLTNKSRNAYTPYGADAKTKTMGLHSRNLDFDGDIAAEGRVNKSTGESCIGLSSIRLNFKVIDPTVFIAKEVRLGSCQFRAIREHELKHVQVDRDVINKYSALIGKAIQDEFNHNVYIAVPFPTGQEDAKKAYLTARIQAVIAANMAQFKIEHTRLQQQVDTIEEYQRVENMCPK